MPIDEDIKQSRDYEMNKYLNSTKNMYETAILQNDDTYDIAHQLTVGFSKINDASILEDSRIIKTLRYAIAPSISQMKFGQIFGHSSIGKFENEKIPREAAKYNELAKIAGNIADFVSKHLDKSRFIWLSEAVQEADSNLKRNTRE